MAQRDRWIPLGAWVALAVTVVSGCSRCGGGSAAGADGGGAGSVDGGTAAAGRPSLPATDLRSALIFVFPEFRGAHGVQGAATLVRELSWTGEAPLAEALRPDLTTKGYTDVQTSGTGEVTAAKTPFTFSARRDGAKATLEISLPLRDQDVGKILHSPAPIGTEHLAFMLPALPGAKTTDEYFVMTLGYVAKPERANFLVRQLVEGLQTLGWTPTEPLVDWKPRQEDGGVGEIPSVLNVVLTHAENGGRFTVQRNAGKVDLRYQQPLTLR